MKIVSLRLIRCDIWKKAILVKPTSIHLLNKTLKSLFISENRLATYFVEHLLEVILGVDPGRYSVTEEDEVLHHSARVDTDHVTHATKGGVLLVIIPDIAQRRTPRPWGTSSQMCHTGLRGQQQAEIGSKSFTIFICIRLAKVLKVYTDKGHFWRNIKTYAARADLFWHKQLNHPKYISTRSKLMYNIYIYKVVFSIGNLQLTACICKWFANVRDGGQWDLLQDPCRHN